MKIYKARYLLPIGAPPIDDGALLVKAGRILAVASYRELAAAHPRVAAVDFGDAVILPPMVNAHTHLELTNFSQWAEHAGEREVPADFVDWILRLVRVRRMIGETAVRASLFEGLWESLAAGTGAVGDILTTLTAAPVYAGTPLRGRIFCEVLGIDQAKVAARLSEVAACQREQPEIAAFAWGLSPHAPYTLNGETLGQSLDFARQHALPLAIHWAETIEELEFLASHSGPLAKRLYPAAGWELPENPVTSGSAAHLPPANILVHGVHVDAAGVESIARAGLAVVLCPRSNSCFGDARAPIASYRQAGVPLALGTDSRASSPSLSLWEELAFARHWFTGALEPRAWLELATAGGAAVLGLDRRLGRLSAGLEASFQVVSQPDGATAATLDEALCAGGRAIAVQALFLGGENVLPPR